MSPGHLEELQDQLNQIEPGAGLRSASGDIGSFFGQAKPVTTELESLKNDLNLQTRVVNQQEELRKQGWPVKDEAIDRPKEMIATIQKRIAELGYKAVPGFMGFNLEPLS